MLFAQRFSREYRKECDDCVIRNLDNKDYVIGQKNVQERVKRLLGFINDHRTRDSKILDIGSGGYMPIFLGTTHACDLSPVAGDVLEKMGFTGTFAIASCDDLPYQDKAFDVAVCTEVIEHLPELEDVRGTFKEIERVAKKWVVTTPLASRSGFRDKWNIEETHRQFFTIEDLKDMLDILLPGLDPKFEKVDHYVFITRV